MCCAIASEATKARHGGRLSEGLAPRAEQQQQQQQQVRSGRSGRSRARERRPRAPSSAEDVTARRTARHATHSGGGGGGRGPGQDRVKTGWDPIKWKRKRSMTYVRPPLSL